MARITLRVPDEMAKQVKRLAALRRVPEADAWRAVIHRGLEAEDPLLVNAVVLTFCLVQRLARAQDRNFLKQAREDARRLLAEAGRLDGRRPRPNDDDTDTYEHERHHGVAREER